MDILRNVAQHPHESVDGSGYPEGLCGDAIPIEVRIVAVADVFDALTSKRPYKNAWSNDDAYAALTHLAGRQLHPECVDALVQNRADVEQFQHPFRER